jgi:tetrahydromethanopterin S-methyltransferase subunit G
MGAIEDVRNLLQDFIAPDIKQIKARLDSIEKRFEGLEKNIDRQHDETLQAIRQITDYTNVVQRLSKLEAKTQ